MALQKSDGQTQKADVMNQRIAAGTIGDDHVIGFSLKANKLNQIISVLDVASYVHGTWTLAATSGANAPDYLGATLYTNNTGDYIDIPFQGTSAALIGNNRPDGGRLSIYVDGVLTPGRVNTYTALSLSNGQTFGITSDATTIYLVNVTSLASAPAQIIIDDEIILYTGINFGSSSLTGCTRGYSNSTATTHNSAASVYQYTSSVETYTQYYQSRVSLWSNNRLAKGNHTLTVVLNQDSHAGATTPGYMDLAGVIVGQSVGAAQLNTYNDYVTVSAAFNGSGIADVTMPPPAATDRQIIGILGVWPTDNTTSVYHQWRADTNQLRLIGPASTSKTVIVTVIVVGPGF